MNQAIKNKDFGTILEIGDEYDVPIETSEFMMLEMSKQNKSIVQSIENMKLLGDGLMFISFTSKG